MYIYRVVGVDDSVNFYFNETIDEALAESDAVGVETDFWTTVSPAEWLKESGEGTTHFSPNDFPEYFPGVCYATVVKCLEEIQITSMSFGLNPEYIRALAEAKTAMENLRKFC